MLFDGGKEILATFGDRLSGKAAQRAAPAGRAIRTGSIVTGVDPRGRRAGRGRVDRANRCPDEDLGGRRAGVAAGRLLAEASGAPCDRAGRIVVPDCTLARAPRDLRRRRPDGLDDLPGVAEVAMQSGIHAANRIKRRLDGRKRRTFRSGTSAAWRPSPGSVPSSASRDPAAGFIGWLIWLLVHITFLTGFRNRISACSTGPGRSGRGSRRATITRAPDDRRVALEQPGEDD